MDVLTSQEYQIFTEIHWRLIGICAAGYKINALIWGWLLLLTNYKPMVKIPASNMMSKIREKF